MSLNKGIAIAASVGVGIPLVFGVGIVFAASDDDEAGIGGGTAVAGGKLRVGNGFVPAQYAGLIEKAAADCDAGLSPGILAAQIQQESNFDPDATSWDIKKDKNGKVISKTPLAKGISQFIDSTWASQGIDGNNDGVKDVRDPEDAIPSQGKMMCGLIKKAKKHPAYNGSPVELALAGYNAGWGWVDHYKGVPPERFADGQTYHYVKNIMANAAKLTMPDSGGKLSSAGWTLPVNGPLGTPYRQKGSAWSSGYHTGIDFPVPTGTPVKAAGPGVVYAAGWAGAYGNQVIIKHDDGRYSQYAHMASTPTVKAGQKVQGGKQIGVSGETGNAFGPHLHFEIRTGPAFGSDISPIAYLRTRGITI